MGIFFGGTTSKVFTAVLASQVWEDFLFKLPLRNKRVRLASEKFVLADESNLSLATGLAS